MYPLLRVSPLGCSGYFQKDHLFIFTHLIKCYHNYVEDDKIALLRVRVTSDLKADKCEFKKVFLKPDCVMLKGPDGSSEKIKPQELDVIGKVLGFFRKV